MSHHITKLERTCGSHPSQWEGLMSDGLAIYIRYRGGKGEISVGADIEAAVDAGLDGQHVFGWTDMSDSSGYLSDDDLRNLLIGNGFSFAPGVLEPKRDAFAELDDATETFVRAIIKHAVDHNVGKGICECCDAAKAYALARVSK